MALDQCADQYVLALAPDAELALSPRADDPDAWLRREAAGHRRLRPTLEAAVGFKPDVTATRQRSAVREEDGVSFLPSNALLERLGQ
jgi:hypothetical protein